jgi:hypothetical protein
MHSDNALNQNVVKRLKRRKNVVNVVKRRKKIYYEADQMLIFGIKPVVNHYAYNSGF